jgi:hypothetical protein
MTAEKLHTRIEDFGRHWTEEPATPRDRAKIVGLIKERAWNLACRRMARATPSRDRDRDTIE